MANKSNPALISLIGLLREMNMSVRCEKCGKEFMPRKPESALKALLSDRKLFDVAPELRDRAVCPACGHEQKSAQYRFFGIMSARARETVPGLTYVTYESMPLRLCQPGAS
jgi:DNA-directed RNA polymerase subunit RPC12/RpoP